MTCTYVSVVKHKYQNTSSRSCKSHASHVMSVGVSIITGASGRGGTGMWTKLVAARWWLCSILRQFLV